MVAVEMTGVRKVFPGGTVALEDLDLGIASGELVCLLGPSGCGKTTALRLLAGFERPDVGRILVDGEDITAVPPQRRGFAMVFQEYSLFPHLTARENIEFGLKVRRVGAVERAQTIDRLLEVTGLGQHADKHPHHMSGGQKQRVALARAIATQPRVLLLDEPLSALDAQVREHLRGEIRRLQQEVGVTTVFVTHDQQEAMAVSDRVAVMNAGRLEQIDPPRVLYSRPRSAFVAGFVGTANRLTARRVGPGAWVVLGAAAAVLEPERTPDPGQPHAPEQDRGTVVVRPEQVRVDRSPSGSGSGPSSARVTSLSFLGALTRVWLEHPQEGTLVADILGGEAEQLSVGDAVEVSVRAGAGPVVLA